MGGEVGRIHLDSVDSGWIARGWTKDCTLLGIRKDC